MNAEQIEFIANRVRVDLTAAIHAGKSDLDLLRGSKRAIERQITESMHAALETYDKIKKERQ